jgi:hypothetical protein
LSSLLDVAHRGPRKAHSLGKTLLGKSALGPLCPNPFSDLPIECSVITHRSAFKNCAQYHFTHRMSIIQTRLYYQHSLVRLQYKHEGAKVRVASESPGAGEGQNQMSKHQDQCDRGLDSRCRDMDGEIRQKRGDTLVKTLRKTYGPDFAPGVRSDMRLDTLRNREGGSLSRLLKTR